MAVPMGKLSKARSRSRAAHHALEPRNNRACARCSHKGPSHRVCANCGHYRGREVIHKGD